MIDDWFFFFLGSYLQRAVDEKFRCVEEKEEETRRLQLLLREKERDLERQRCVLANNEETITVRKHTFLPSFSQMYPLLAASLLDVCYLCVRAWRCWCGGKLWSWSRCVTPGGTSSGSSRRARRGRSASWERETPSSASCRRRCTLAHRKPRYRQGRGFTETRKSVLFDFSGLYQELCKKYNNYNQMISQSYKCWLCFPLFTHVAFISK